jgi:L-ascorbate metabolism protein UlaG (beta-lactamase superfamily)
MPESSLVREWVRIGRQAHNSPKLTGKALVDAISVQEVWPGSLAIWHLNQLDLLSRGGVAYFDPYLSDELERLTKDRLDEHSRLFRSPLKGSDITNADFIFCSHNHLDHIDPPAIREIGTASSRAMFVIPLAARKRLLSLGIEENRLVTFRGDDDKVVGRLHVAAVPAAHTAFDYNESDGFPYLGFMVSVGGITIYHAGDCVLYDGLIERLSRHRPDVAFLPINGDDWFKHGRNIMGNFSYKDAVNLAVAAGVDMVIPMHFGQHAVNTEKPGLFIDYIHENCRYQKSHVMVPGERFFYVK